MPVLALATVVLVAPPPSVAMAEPVPPPGDAGHERRAVAPDVGSATGSGPDGRSVPEPAPGPGPASTANGAAAALLAQLRALSREVSEATEAHLSAGEELAAHREQVAELDESLAATRTELADRRRDVGALAGQQYRDGGTALPAHVRLLLGEDIEAAARGERLSERAGVLHAAAVRELRAGEERSDELAREARKALDTEQTLARQREREWDTVRGRLADIEQLLDSLTESQREEIDTVEREHAEQARGKSIPAPGEDLAPSALGARALDYALAQIGKPYAWGAEGPASFDCSGLTSSAWAHAGRSIPRTSQRQWEQLERVPLDELRPGDLVVYFPDATEVALYAGAGMVVHAARPGTTVRVSPLTVDPALGAVRPDAGEPPLSSYEPPELPGAAPGLGTDRLGGGVVPEADGETLG